MRRRMGEYEGSMTMPPPEQGRNIRVLAGICVAAAVGFIGLTWLSVRFGLIQLGGPSFMVEKAWYSDGDVYVDFKNTGWGTAHGFTFSAGPGQFLGVQQHPNVQPGGTFHLSLYGAHKKDVHYVIAKYDEGKETFIIPWSNPDSSDYETVTNILPETSPLVLSLWEWSRVIR